MNATIILICILIVMAFFNAGMLIRCFKILVKKQKLLQGNEIEIKVKTEGLDKAKEELEQFINQANRLSQALDLDYTNPIFKLLEERIEEERKSKP